MEAESCQAISPRRDPDEASRNAALSWSGRRRLAEPVVGEGWTLAAAAAAAGVSVRCARKWVGRYRLGPNMREDALVVPMTDPRYGPPGAWMVYYNPSKSEARRRFTLAHEIGHVVLHGAPHDVAAAARGGGGRKQREREVDRFAAALLMPERFIGEAVQQYGLDVEQLRGLFLVNRQAMEIRLRELGLA